MFNRFFDGSKLDHFDQAHYSFGELREKLEAHVVMRNLTLETYEYEYTIRNNTTNGIDIGHKTGNGTFLDICSILLDDSFDRPARFVVKRFFGNSKTFDNIDEVFEHVKRVI